MTDTEAHGHDPEGVARRLHSGPLQAFFAGLLMLETSSPDRDEKLAEVLTIGAEELKRIIADVQRSTSEPT